MKFFTVRYICNRDYPCFRTIEAPDATTAGLLCENRTHNFKELVEVIDYVGQQ